MSANVIWQETTVDRARRWQALGQQGATVWFTGLPGAGKTTIASAVEARLIDAGRCAYRCPADRGTRREIIRSPEVCDGGWTWEPANHITIA